MNRRGFFKHALKMAAASYLALFSKAAPLFSQILPASKSSGIPMRPLGRTGFQATLFGLGGEGILRTFGRRKEAVPVIERAFELGVNYADTAPAYAQSQDYYGEVFRRDPGKRDKIFLASKTHERSYQGSMRLLEESLRRLGTDHLDLWQLHDLREQSDLDEIFSKEGAIHAVEEAKKKGLIRFAGITGHHNPFILKQAAERYDFDTVLAALNAADIHSFSFIQNFLPIAIEKKMGIIGMKVYSHGKILKENLLTPGEAMAYVLSLPVSHVIIGCQTTSEVEENMRLAREFEPLSPEKMAELERRTAPFDQALTSYKGRA